MMFCRSVTVEEWIDFTERNLTSGEKQRQNSFNLRQIADSILQTTYNDLLRQKDSTDRALEYRIYETRDAKDKLQDHLNKVIRSQVICACCVCERVFFCIYRVHTGLTVRKANVMNALV